MLKRLLFAGAVLCLPTSGLWAQTYKDANGTVAPGFVPLIGCANGVKCAGPVSQANPLPVVVTGGGSGGGGGGTVAQGLAASPAGAWPVFSTINGAAVSTSNGLFVNPATGATFPVSGSVAIAGTASITGAVSVSNFPATQNVSAAQSGAWSTGRTWSLSSSADAVTATISGTPNVTITSLPAFPAGSNAIGSVIVANLPATQPVSATSLPLPLGAATSANQASVIGTISAGTAATNSLAIGGVYNTTLSTLTNGQQAAIQLDALGRSIVNVAALPPIPSGSNTIGAVNTVASNPASIYSGQQTCNLTAASLPSQALVNGVVVKALKSNTATVYLGSTSVTASTGYPLVAGESISYAVSNLSAVNLICQNATDVVAITGN